MGLFPHALQSEAKTSIVCIPRSSRFELNAASLVAALGALATVMVSLTGFFAQQLLQFETCSQRNNNAIVAVAKTNVFNATGMAIGPGIWDEYRPLAVAINVGLIQPVQDQTSVLTRGCVSGNCSFPSTDGSSISTLAITHDCEDVTAHMFSRNITNEYNETEPALTFGDQESNDYYQFWIRTQEQGEVLATRGDVALGAVGRPDWIAGVSLLFRATYTGTEYSAVQCKLYPTVNTYGVNITNGVLEEKVINSTRIPYTYYENLEGDNAALDHRPQAHWPYRTATPYMMRNGSQELCTGSPDPQPGMEIFDKKIGEQIVEKPSTDPWNNTNLTSTEDLGTIWYYSEDCVWYFWVGSTNSIHDTFQNLFDHQRLTYWRTTLNGSLQLRSIWGIQERDGGEISGMGNISLETIDATMGDVAKAMTNIVRTHGFNGPAWYAGGDMWYTTTCVRVRWKNESRSL